MGMRALRDIDFHASSDAPSGARVSSRGADPARAGRTHPSWRPSARASRRPSGRRTTRGDSSSRPAGRRADRPRRSPPDSSRPRTPTTSPVRSAFRRHTADLVGLKPSRGRTIASIAVRCPHRNECRRRRHPIRPRHRRRCSTRSPWPARQRCCPALGQPLPAAAGRTVHPGVQRQRGRPRQCRAPPSTALRCWRHLAAASRSRPRHRSLTRRCGRRRQHCWPSTSRPKLRPGRRRSAATLGESDLEATTWRMVVDRSQPSAAVELLAAESLHDRAHRPGRSVVGAFRSAGHADHRRARRRCSASTPRDTSRDVAARSRARSTSPANRRSACRSVGPTMACRAACRSSRPSGEITSWSRWRPPSKAAEPWAAASGYGERMIVAVVNFELTGTAHHRRGSDDVRSQRTELSERRWPAAQALPLGRGRAQCGWGVPLGKSRPRPRRSTTRAGAIGSPPGMARHQRSSYFDSQVTVDPSSIIVG